MSLNATSATHIHSNIQSLIEESEKLAKDALRTVTEAIPVRNPHGLWSIPSFPRHGGRLFLKVFEQTLSGLNLCLPIFFSGGIFLWLLSSCDISQFLKVIILLYKD